MPLPYQKFAIFSWPIITTAATQPQTNVHEDCQLILFACRHTLTKQNWLLYSAVCDGILDWQWEAAQTEWKKPMNKYDIDTERWLIAINREREYHFFTTKRKIAYLACWSGFMAFISIILIYTRPFNKILDLILFSCCCCVSHTGVRSEIVIILFRINYFIWYLQSIPLCVRAFFPYSSFERAKWNEMNWMIRTNLWQTKLFVVVAKK